MMLGLLLPMQCDETPFIAALPLLCIIGSRVGAEGRTSYWHIADIVPTTSTTDAQSAGRLYTMAPADITLYVVQKNSKHVNYVYA